MTVQIKGGKWNIQYIITDTNVPIVTKEKKNWLWGGGK